MKNFSITYSLILAALNCLLAARAQAQWLQQQIVLQPGWNAVFLEVDPAQSECDALFAGLPIESAWDLNRPADSAQFVRDAFELIPGSPGWLTWFPPNHPIADQTTLFGLRDGRAYLIKTTNSQPITWTIEGRPSLRRLTWQPGTVNLVGFHVGSNAPSFQNLFAGQSGLASQPVYSLDTAGVWRAVTNLSTARPKAGEAYWVRCKSPTQAAGTILVEAGSRQGVNFSGAVTEQSLRIRNASTTARQITVRLLPSAPAPTNQPPVAGPVPLEYWRASYATTNIGWEPLSAPLTFASLGAGQEWNIRLGARLGSSFVPGSTYQSLIEVSDDLGTRWLIPVAATAGPSPANTFAHAGFLDAAPHAGLWVGDVVLNAVSQPAHPGNPLTPRPAGGSLSFRLIVHVDGAGTARLLQQAFMVRKPAVVEPDPEDPLINRVLEPARMLAVTDESLIPGLIGTAEVVGRRVSSPAFSFQQPIPLTGGEFGEGALQATIALGYDHPLNPFKHTYHPDHNNLDERFEQKLPEGKEAFTVARALSLEFTAADPTGLNPPNWGSTELGGIYRETITGLHRNTIHVSGNFRLVRVLTAPALNQ
jgi:hypothetical protein